MEKQRVIYLDILRILACLAVIFIHVGGQHWMALDIHSVEWNVYNAYRAVSRWAVPVFIMISGSIFMVPEIKLDVKKLYTKNLFRIICAFLFWSLIYAIYKFNGSLEGFPANVIRGEGHMWFMFLIAFLYIILPVFRKILYEWKVEKVFLPLALILGFVIPGILIPMTNGKIVILLKVMQKAFGWTGYFYLGYYLKKVDIKKNRRVVLYVLGILGVLSSYCNFKAYTLKQGYAVGDIYDNISITILSESVAIFVLIKSINWKFGDNKMRLITKISQYTFGIYLVHMLILYCIDDILEFNYGIWSMIILPVVVLFVFFISMGISFVLHKIPFLNKYVV